MLAAAIIVFREAIEAGLIVGIVLAATIGVPRRGIWIGGGVIAGACGACVMAAFAAGLSDAFAGTGQELFKAIILLIAVAMLIWHNAWMAVRGRDLSLKIRAMGGAVATGEQPLIALAVVCGVAILREGFEVVLFLAGAGNAGENSAGSMLLGGALGLVAGGIVATLLSLGLAIIPPKRLFSLMAVLIALIAAGLAAQAVDFLEQADLIFGMTEPLWDSAEVIDGGSLLGRTLHTLIGYSDRPDVFQLGAYIVTLLLMLAPMQFAGRHRPVRARLNEGVTELR